MTITWVARVKQQMQELNISREKLATEMGVTYGAITHYLTGRRQPPLKQIKNMSLVLKKSPAWLLYGEETIIKEREDEKLLDPNLKQIPLLTWINATKLINGNSDIILNCDKFIPHFLSIQEGWFALSVKDDTMTTQTLTSHNFIEGDIIIINPNIEPQPGNFVIALLLKENELTFKKYIIDNGIKYLKPLNPQYPLLNINDNVLISGVIASRINVLDNN